MPSLTEIFSSTKISLQVTMHFHSDVCTSRDVKLIIPQMVVCHGRFKYHFDKALVYLCALFNIYIIKNNINGTNLTHTWSKSQYMHVTCTLSWINPSLSWINPMGPTWGPSEADRPRWAPCWPHELCYLGWLRQQIILFKLYIDETISIRGSYHWKERLWKSIYQSL